MMPFLWVAVGGGLGACARYALRLLLHGQGPITGLPWSTLLVNVVGCLAIGSLAAWGERFGGLSDAAKLFLVTGVLGGFTTFSAFGLETIEIMRRGDWGLALGYVGVSVVGSLAGAGVGFWLVARS